MAAPDTKLWVGEGGAGFSPPVGWRYARGSEGSIATNADGSALMVLMPFPDPADLAPAVEAMVSRQGIGGLKLDKLKRRLKKPQQTLPAAAGTIDVWEVDLAQQGSLLQLGGKGNGTLLVLVGKPDPERTLLGIAFVVDSVAEADAPKIMQAVQSLRGN